LLDALNRHLRLPRAAAAEEEEYSMCDAVEIRVLLRPRPRAPVVHEPRELGARELREDLLARRSRKAREPLEKTRAGEFVRPHPRARHRRLVLLARLVQNGGLPQCLQTVSASERVTSLRNFESARS